jgi:hypothetical protein
MITSFDNANISVDVSIRTPLGELSHDFKRMLRVQFKEFIYALDEAKMLPGGRRQPDSEKVCRGSQS